jgi:pimeloyl-ACP methyl ester carboxylesterase
VKARAFSVGELRAWEWPGDEPGALLLHGIGNYGRYWDFFADAVAGRLRLVAPDARGHGESPKPAEGYAPADFVADAVAVIEATGLKRPIVVGHSMGGMHAVALALAHPDRVSALVLVDSGPRVEHAGGSRARRLSLERPDRFPDEAAALAYLKETSPGYSDAVYENRLAFAFRRFSDGALEWRSSKDSLRKIFEAESGTVWDRLREISCPVLVVRGTRSPSLSAETVKEMLTTLRDARSLELDAGHNVALDRPRELADAVVAFAHGVVRQ